jgi:threonine synthase
MDISKASNFERFVFDLTGRDGAKTKDLFSTQISQKGMFDLGQDPAFKEAAAKYGFASGKSTHADRLATIQDVYQKHGTIIDTHTADGMKVAREHLSPGAVMIVLETALPIKFAETIVEALGREPDRPAQFIGIEALPKRVVNMPANVEALKAYITQHARF